MRSSFPGAAPYARLSNPPPIADSHEHLMEASRKVNSLNAYVTGVGASKHVVVWDTTIAKMSTPEIAFVFGHGMGHYGLHHAAWGMLIGAIGLRILLGLG